jgi:hypothetical protein
MLFGIGHNDLTLKYGFTFFLSQAPPDGNGDGANNVQDGATLVF